MSTLEEPPSFIQEGYQESSSEPKPESRAILKVKFPFNQRAKEALESLGEESTSQKDAPSEVDQEVASVVTISDDDRPALAVPGTSSSQSAVVPGHKQCLEDQASESSTPKKRAIKEEATTTHMWSLPSGVKEEDLHPSRYETYSQDYDWVHQV